MQVRLFACTKSALPGRHIMARLGAMKHQLDFEKPIVELQNKLEELKKHQETHSLDISIEEEVSLIEKKLEETRRQVFANLSAWDRVQIARHRKRPYTLDYVQAAFADFSELHGDRLFARSEEHTSELQSLRH